MRTKAFSILSVVLISMTLLSCNTEEQTDNLTNGPWNFVEITADSEDQAAQVAIAALELIFESSTIEFMDDGTFAVSSPTSEETITGSWTLLLDTNLTLNFDEGDYTIINGTVQTLTGTSFIYTQKMPYDISKPLDTFTLTTSWAR